MGDSVITCDEITKYFPINPETVQTNFNEKK